MAFKTINNPKLKKDTYSIDVEGVEKKVIIQQPDFDNIATAMGVLMGMGNSLNIVGSGKVIFETCCVEYDEFFDEPENVKYLAKICMSLATDYVMPASEDVKKN